MNRNTAIIGIVGIIVIGGLIFYGMKNAKESNTNATSTPVGIIPTGQSQVASVPLVVTNSAPTSYDTAVIVSGTVTPKGAFTTYWYEYGTVSSLGNKTADQNIGSGFAAISAPIYIAGLTKNTDYFYRLVAKNQFGTVVGTTYSFKTTTGTPAPVGSNPTVKTLAASGVARTSATLIGEIVPNKASTTYWFEFGTSANLGSVTAFQSVGNGDRTLSASAVVSNLNAGTQYFYRINAQNQFGTVNGSILTFTTSGPSASAPTATTRNVSDIATSSASISGTVNPNGLETTYWFEYSTASLLGAVTPQTTGHISAGAGTDNVSVVADVVGLKTKTTYFVRLVAQNSVGTTKGSVGTFKTK